MLQAFIVVPGSPPSTCSPRRRGSAGGSGSGAAWASRCVAAAAWWVAIVALWPASSRPYIGGSQDNSILNLIFGYNGFGRITGNETGSVVGGGGGRRAGRRGRRRPDRDHAALRLARWGRRSPGCCRRRSSSWPPALGVRRAPRTDGRRAAVLIWGSWLVVTGLVFSFAQGIIHPYYTVVLAPAIGALVGIGVTGRGRGAGSLPRGSSLAAASRHGRLGVRAARPDAGLASGAALRRAGGGRRRRGRAARARRWLGSRGGGSRRARLALAVAPLGLALVAGLAGPAAYALDTVAYRPHRRDPERRARPGRSAARRLGGAARPAVGGGVRRRHAAGSRRRRRRHTGGDRRGTATAAAAPGRRAAAGTAPGGTDGEAVRGGFGGGFGGGGGLGGRHHGRAAP